MFFFFHFYHSCVVFYKVLVWRQIFFVYHLLYSYEDNTVSHLNESLNTTASLSNPTVLLDGKKTSAENFLHLQRGNTMLLKTKIQILTKIFFYRPPTDEIWTQ